MKKQCAFVLFMGMFFAPLALADAVKPMVIVPEQPVSTVSVGQMSNGEVKYHIAKGFECPAFFNDDSERQLVRTRSGGSWSAPATGRSTAGSALSDG